MRLRGGLDQVGDRADHADADLVVGQGDVPEPRVPVLGVEDQGRAFVDALVALAAAIVGVDRCLLQFGLGLGQLELAADQRALAGGIDDDLCGKIAGLAVGEFGAHAGGAVSLEQHFEYPGTLMYLGTFGAGVVEEHRVEWAAQDLPSYCAFVGVGVRRK